MNTNQLNKNKRLLLLLSGAAAILSLPLIAMQFTAEVDWNSTDFFIMGILLFGTAIICELILRFIKSTKQRIVLCGIVMVILFLTWAELAVGLFGTPFTGS